MKNQGQNNAIFSKGSQVKSLLLITLLGGSLFVLGACSEKSFTATDGSVFQQCVDARPEVKCIVTCLDDGTCNENYDYNIDTQSQVTDILFVVDNSGSMYTEQVEMGSKFPSFLSTLSNLDYRIAITTTDISGTDNPPDTSNGFGAFQDGKLLQFPNNDFFLDGTYSLLDEQDYFERTIKRDETEQCDLSNYQNCPSGDERAILAAAKTLENNPNNFIREVGHLALVILSDEDEGSNGRNMLDSVEQPQKFIDYFKQLYPNKSLAAHSIIIQPESTSTGRQCYNQQASGNTPRGEYGDVYAELTSLTDGILGNICANDYSAQLESIGDSVAQTREVLPCRPLNDQITISYDPEPSQPIEVSKNFDQNELIFGKGLAFGTKIRLQFSCAQ